MWIIANSFLSGALFTMMFVELARGNNWFAAGHLMLSAFNFVCAYKNQKQA
jgi:hypothetical protein